MSPAPAPRAPLLTIPGAKARAIDLGFAAGWSAVRALPAPAARRVFQYSADRATSRGGAGVTQLWRNLRRVVGPDMSQDDLAELVEAGMRSYSRYWLETFRLPSIDKRRVVADVVRRFRGMENIDNAMTANKGLVIALPHMGNWDVAGLWLVSHGVPFMTVAERLKPEALFDRFVAYRESLGMRVIPLTGGQQPPIEPLVQHLRSGGCVCLVADRDLSLRGVPVNFFGETARFPAGPAMLAAMTGATLVTATLWFEGDGWATEVSAPIELPEGKLAARTRAGVALIAEHFERGIAAHPQDWHMLQRLWTADLDASRYEAGDAGGAALT